LNLAARSRRGKARLAIRSFDDFEISTRQQIPQDLPIVLLILDHRDALAHGCPTCASTRTGTVKENCDPLPGSDSTQIHPPCISMMRLAIERPNPVPPFLRVIDAAVVDDLCGVAMLIVVVRADIRDFLDDADKDRAGRGTPRPGRPRPLRASAHAKPQMHELPIEPEHVAKLGFAQPRRACAIVSNTG
jgi:hypothetical protein